MLEQIQEQVSAELDRWRPSRNIHFREKKERPTMPNHKPVPIHFEYYDRRRPASVS